MIYIADQNPDGSWSVQAGGRPETRATGPTRDVAEIRARQLVEAADRRDARPEAGQAARMDRNG